MNRAQLTDIINRYEEASFTVNRRLSAMMRELMPGDITIDQFSTLRYMRSRERTTSSELADVFCVGKSSITAIITRLVEKGFITRLPDEKDRRVTYLTLTQEGRDIASEMEGKIEDLLGGYLCHFDDEEAKLFIRTYEKLAAVLMESPHEG
ncbi:MarR family winged helix-turn-helix transcriptional regulator [Paenibacillus sp. GCM10023252]|uniref:MarR family winged helix-turn-helix transcriptional regulator n=1 Tax=Paenibacillus sp. GCM10023252 TaxID=3252649 RepID=UPI00362215E1